MKPYKAFWEIIRLTPGLYALNAVLQIFRSCIPLLPALIVREIMNRLTAQPGLSAGLGILLVLLVGVVLARVTALLASVTADAVSSSYGTGLLLRNSVARILHKPGAQGMRHSSGDVVNRLTTDTAAVSEMLMSTLVVVGSAAQAGIAFAVMFSIAPLITSVVMVPLLAAGLLINMTSNRIKKYHAQSRQAAGEVSSFLREVFHAAQAIQLANAQGRVGDRFREVNDTRRRRTLQSRFFTAVFLSSVWTTTSALGTGIVLVMAAGSFRAGSFTVGDLALFVAYLGWITEFTALFSQNLAAYKQATVSFQRLVDVLPDGATPAELVEHHPVRPVPDPMLVEKAGGQPLEVLKVSGLTYQYPESGRGVKAVDLTIPRGSFVVVTGPVGSGKTTLLRSVLGLLPQQEGSISWNGRELDDPAEFFVSPHTAYTPQVPRLSSETVRENILAGLSVPPDRLQGAIRSAVLDRDLSGLEKGLDTLIGTRGAKLSGGQAQRVAAARMFVRDAELLVFDDLSSALDVNTERLVWERLFQQEDRTCLVVSHRRAAFEHATHIVVLKDGLVEHEGTLEELRRVSPQMRELWHTSDGADLDES
ncbi:ABC transporter ATP-binding protein [Streptomyces diacarni]|uniref:ABC transporter ATP-binding protein n=1 Tax=Streptomyces diacarni TaxID=2800381 RepID=UPI0033D13D8C